MGEGRFSGRMRSMPAAVRREVAQAMFAAGDVIRVAAQISITEGAVSGKRHEPSTPGQPPNNDTGDLANGIETRQVAPLNVEIASTAGHSEALEYGTSKMAARPFMRPAANANRLKVNRMLSRAARRAVRRHMGI